MVEAAGHDHERDAGVEHLGGHEMAEVVKSERAEPGGPAMAKEGFGDPVRLPGGDAAVVAEHETAAFGANVPSVVGEHLAGGRVKVDDMAALGLRGGEDRSVGSFDPAGTERDAAACRGARCAIAGRAAGRGGRR